MDPNTWTKEYEKSWFDKHTKTHSALVKALKFTTLLADNEINRQKQLKIANKYILDLTLYLSENMTSDLAPKVMSNLKKIKNATQDENQLKVLEKYDKAGMKGETIAMYLEKINDEINLFIRNNIPQIKVETQVPKIKTYANSSASYSQLNRQVGCKSDYSAEKKRDIFNSDYRNHLMTWKGRIIIVSSNSVSLDTEEPKIDFFKTDLEVSFNESGAGYDLKEGQTITVRFLMKSRGGCYHPFEGVNAIRVN